MELVNVKFLRSFHGVHTFCIRICPSFRVTLISDQKSYIILIIVDIGCHFKSFAIGAVHYLLKNNVGKKILRRIFLPSGVTCIPFFSSHINKNKILCWPGIMDVSYYIKVWIFFHIHGIHANHHVFILVRVPLSPMVSIFPISHSFIVFFIRWLPYVTLHWNSQ